MTDMTFSQYEALAYLVTYGNLYHLRALELPAKVENTDEWWRSADPENPGRHMRIVRDEDARWLLDNYMARPADFDPVLSRGKLVPTDKAAPRLKDHGLTPESEGVGVHLGHCCLQHGCKYGHEFCPVVTKMFPPDHDNCAVCYEDEQMDGALVEGVSDGVLVRELEARGYVVTKKEE